MRNGAGPDKENLPFEDKFFPPLTQNQRHRDKISAFSQIYLPNQPVQPSKESSTTVSKKFSRPA